MTVKNRTDLTTQASTDVADNEVGDVTPADLRTLFLDVIDSFHNVQTDGAVFSDNYAIGEANTQRKWHDNKDIFRVVVDGGALSVGANSIATVGAVSSLLSISGSVSDGTTSTAFPGASDVTADTFIQASVTESTGAVNIEVGSGWSASITSYTAVIEFTKV